MGDVAAVALSPPSEPLKLSCLYCLYSGKADRRIFLGLISAKCARPRESDASSIVIRSQSLSERQLCNFHGLSLELSLELQSSLYMYG